MAENNTDWRPENGTPAGQQQDGHTEPAAASATAADNTTADTTPATGAASSDAPATGATSPADDTPDYAAAKGEQTVVSSAPTTEPLSAADAARTADDPVYAKGSPYRPAPEYGAYGPVPTQPGAPAGPQNQQGPSAQPNMQGQQFPGPGFGPAPQGGPTGPTGPTGPQNPFASGNPFTGRGPQAPNGGPQFPPQGPAGPGNGNPFAQQGPTGPNGSAAGSAPKGANQTVRTVVVAIISAIVAIALSLGIGFAALTNGWVTIPGSSSLANVQSNKSGSGSATAKSGEAPDWQAVAADVSDSVVSITTVVQNGAAKGSGAIIDAGKGYVVTNNHVIDGAQQIQVTLSNGQIYSAQVVGTDTTTDLAVIRLDNPPSDLKAVTFADSDKLAVGEPVMAVGNPLGYDDTATTGIVSALNRPVSVMDEESGNQIVTNAVQIDAAVNPGNSGGPSFNAAGQVIGINSSIAVASGSSSSSSAGSIGIGFAIPANLVKRVANEIIKDGKVQHVALGVTIKTAAVEADGVTRAGAQVVTPSTGGSAVVSGSPADKAGLKVNDTIVAYNGNAVNSMQSLLGFVRATAMGETVKLTIVRDGHTMDVNVTLDQAESDVNGSTRREQQGGGSQDQDQDQNQGGRGGNGYDGGGLFDPFGLW